MAEMTIANRFKAKHGTNHIIWSEYQVSVTVSGPIVLGFTDYCDSVRLEKYLDAICVRLNECYLDDLMGRATHEMIGLWMMHHLGIQVQQIAVQADGMSVTVTRMDYRRHDFDALVLMHKAMSAFLRGNLAEAEQYINSSIQIDIDNPVAFLVRGRIYRYTNRYNQAIIDFSRVVSKCPNWSEGHRNLGNMYLFLEKYSEMIPHFQEAVRLAPRSSLAQNNLGYALMLTGDYAHGYIHCAKAVELNPKYQEAHMDLAAICESLHRIEEATLHREMAQKLAKEETENETHYQLADVDGLFAFGN